MLDLQAVSGTASGGRLHQVAGNSIEMGQWTAREEKKGMANKAMKAPVVRLHSMGMLL